jgi:hypothetical protein
MWPLLKAEFIYDRLRLLIVSFFCLVCLITIWFGVKWERNVSPMTMLILIISALVAVYEGEQVWINKKRDRLHVSLPISSWRVGFFHVVYPIIVWVAILILYEISYLILQLLSGNTRTKPSFLQVLTSSGLFLIINATVLLSRDMRTGSIKKSLHLIIFIFWILIFIVSLLPFYIVSNFMGIFGENMRLQIVLTALSESPVAFLSLGAVLSSASLFVFVKRRSYAGS